MSRHHVPCYACGHAPELTGDEQQDVKNHTMRIITQVIQAYNQRAMWSEKLQSEGMKAPWQDPMDRLCIVVGIICNDLNLDTQHHPSMLINNSNGFLNDFTAWLVHTGQAEKKPTPVQTINDWGLTGCTGWYRPETDPRTFLTLFAADIMSGAWVPSATTFWSAVHGPRPEDVRG